MITVSENFEHDNNISIVLENGDNKGSQFTGNCIICDSPTCTCSDMFFDLKTEKDNEVKNLYFGIDIIEKKPIKTGGKRKILKKDYNFSNKFLNDLTKDDINNLLKLFLSYKKNIIENTPLTEVDAIFPHKRIENEQPMIGYYEIFRYAENIFIKINDKEYVVDDQYCLESQCKCKSTIITLIPTKRENPYMTGTCFRLDYNKKKWEVLDKGSEQNTGILMKKIIDNKLCTIFKERHIKLRTLYRYYLNKINISAKTANGKSSNGIDNKKKLQFSKKIGRNKPCPCGSGKKFKNCCL